jgi:hypothetical protein
MRKIRTNQYQIPILIVGQMGSHLSFSYSCVDVNQLYLWMIMPLYFIGVRGQDIEICIFVRVTGVG